MNTDSQMRLVELCNALEEWASQTSGKGTAEIADRAHNLKEALVADETVVETNTTHNTHG